jgi:hypothetical protein
VSRGSFVNLTLTFAPTEKRPYSASVKLRGPGGCPEETVELRGEGSDEVLSWTPSALDFGFVTPGAQVTREVVFRNDSKTPITLSDITSSIPTDFLHEVPAGVSPESLTIPGNTTAFSMHVACTPTGLGTRSATLTFHTPLRRIPVGTISLKCVGGGPQIKVTPRPTLAFGRVAYFAGSPSIGVTRKVSVQNVGNAPPAGDVAANLHLGIVPAGELPPAQPPLFALTPSNANTDASELSVSLASPYDPNQGLSPVAGRNALDLAVALKPKSVGLKEAELVIYSNDLAEPVVHLTVTANAQELPPCKYAVTPAGASFGLVAPPNYKDLPITVTNLGLAAGEVCHLSGIDLAPGSDPAYSLVGGAVPEKQLQPAESMQLVVRVAPQGPLPTTVQTLVGSLLVNASSPTQPQTLVPLSTSVGPACLAVTPDPLDFGTVKVGCNSRSRDFSIYNVCSTPVTLGAFSMQAAAGQAPGGANCPGTASCPEFRLVATPQLPAGGLVVAPGAAPVTFQVKYSPLDLGEDQGAVAISALQGGQSLTYLVGLKGRGDSIGQQTDSFTQQLRPQADILLVIDDSGSMEDEQNSLANNFASFIQYAVATGVDYQMGIVTTSTDEMTCQGWTCATTKGAGIMNRQSSGGSQLGPVLTDRTAAVANAFRTLVKVGITGSGNEQGLETAVMALTAPRITNENAGFLRPDANLAVLVVSDAIDSSPQPQSYYQNRLINLKGFNRQSMFTFNNIGPYNAVVPRGCSYDPDHTPNKRYEDLVRATGGIKEEICTANWAATLQNLGKTAFGYRTQFFLNTPPETGTGAGIEVKVDGQVILQSGNTWSYDSASNSITFQPSAAPGAGQTLTLTYTNACF